MTYASTSDNGHDDTVAYPLTIEPSSALELMKGQESSQHAVIMNEEMESLDEGY